MSQKSPHDAYQLILSVFKQVEMRNPARRHHTWLERSGLSGTDVLRDRSPSPPLPPLSQRSPLQKDAPTPPKLSGRSSSARSADSSTSSLNAALAASIFAAKLKNKAAKTKEAQAGQGMSLRQSRTFIERNERMATQNNSIVSLARTLNSTETASPRNSLSLGTIEEGTATGVKAVQELVVEDVEEEMDRRSGRSHEESAANADAAVLGDGTTQSPVSKPNTSFAGRAIQRRHSYAPPPDPSMVAAKRGVPRRHSDETPSPNSNLLGECSGERSAEGRSRLERSSSERFSNSKEGNPRSRLERSSSERIFGRSRLERNSNERNPRRNSKEGNPRRSRDKRTSHERLANLFKQKRGADSADEKSRLTLSHDHYSRECKVLDAEFLKGDDHKVPLTPEQSKHFKLIFELNDADGDGKADLSDLASFLDSLGYGVPLRDLQEMIAGMGIEEVEGKITESDFLEFMRRTLVADIPKSKLPSIHKLLEEEVSKVGTQAASSSNSKASQQLLAGPRELGLPTPYDHDSDEQRQADSGPLLTKAQCSVVLDRLGFKLDPQSLSDLFDELDIDRDGKLSEAELITCIGIIKRNMLEVMQLAESFISLRKKASSNRISSCRHSDAAMADQSIEHPVYASDLVAALGVTEEEADEMIFIADLKDTQTIDFTGFHQVVVNWSGRSV